MLIYATMFPFVGDRPIASIRPTEIQAWIRGRTDVLAQATVEVVYRICAAILDIAVDDRVIARSPASCVRPPLVEQVEALIDGLPDRYEALVVLAAGAGLPQGEFSAGTPPVPPTEAPKRMATSRTQGRSDQARHGRRAPGCRRR